MRAWLKFVVVWLVALALPAQAMASATMVHCGQSHQRMHAAQTGSNHHASVHHQHATHGAQSSHHHDAEVADTSDHAAPPNHDADRPDRFTDLGKYKCSLCASCCAGIGLLSTMPKVPAPVFAATVFVAVVPSVDAFAADGPDRPPRIVHA